MKTNTPLSHIRVLNIGIAWAGRVASMLLAEQGAEVIEVVRPGRKSHPADPVLDRSKRLLELDMKQSSGREQIINLAKTANVIIENMRPGVAERLGLGYEQLGGDTSGLVYISLPGFAVGDPRRDDAAWEGSIAGATGVYTDLSTLGRLIGSPPIYTGIPMASAYGGILGATTAGLGFLGYLNTGLGQRFEIPLADAVMSAMALLIAELEHAPSHYDFPALDKAVSRIMMPILRDVRKNLSKEHVKQVQEYLQSNARPGFNTYTCGDGKLLFVVASDHITHTRGFLQTVGVYDQLISEGMTAESPYSEGRTGNNLNSAHSMTSYWRNRMITLISEKIRVKSAKEWEHLLRDANVPASVVQTTYQWLQDPILLEAGVTIDLENPVLGKIRQPNRYLSIKGSNVSSPELVSSSLIEGDVDWMSEKKDVPKKIASLSQNSLLNGIKVIDLSNIIAGPAAGRTLAEFGAEVIRVDSPAPFAGPYATMWFGVDVNQGKRAIILDLKTEKGKKVLSSLVKKSDVVLHNFLDSSAEKMGISYEQLQQIKPDIISCQISAWGGVNGGPYKDDPSFDPVLQAASGIMARYGSSERPALHGIASCVDYMTGFLAVNGIVQALIAKNNGLGGSFVRTSLAMGAQLVQFPFMLMHSRFKPGEEVSGQDVYGTSIGQRLYNLSDGWAYLGCRPEDEGRLVSLLKAEDKTIDSVSKVLGIMKFGEVQKHLSELAGASVIRPEALAKIREERTRNQGERESNWINSGSFRLRRGEHPSGYYATICEPTWVRPDRSPVSQLNPAPWPGQHTKEVLEELGFDQADIEDGAFEGWKVLKHYLPL